MREQIAELRKDLDTERKRSRQSAKDNAARLEKCQLVIGRLVTELEVATGTCQEQAALEPVAMIKVTDSGNTGDRGEDGRQIGKSLCRTIGSTTPPRDAGADLPSFLNTCPTPETRQASKMQPSGGDTCCDTEETTGRLGSFSDLRSAIATFFGQLDS